MWVAIQPVHKDVYRQLLEERKPSLSNSAQKRLATVIKKLN